LPVIAELWKLRQGNHESEANLGYMVRPHFKQMNKNVRKEGGEREREKEERKKGRKERKKEERFTIMETLKLGCTIG
jgi:hypothetical protein